MSRTRRPRRGARDGRSKRHATGRRRCLRRSPIRRMPACRLTPSRKRPRPRPPSWRRSFDECSCRASSAKRRTAGGGIRPDRPRRVRRQRGRARRGDAHDPSGGRCGDLVTARARAPGHRPGRPERRARPGPCRTGRRGHGLGRRRRPGCRGAGDLVGRGRVARARGRTRVASPGARRPTARLAAEMARRAEVTVAERDPVEPLERDARSAIARSLLAAAGFRVEPTPAGVRAIDPEAIVAVRP